MVGFLLVGLLMAVGISSLIATAEDEDPEVNDTEGTSGDNVLHSSSEEVNILEGGDGNDQLFGNGGTDFLFGGDGNDLLRGSGGTDILVDDNGADTLIGGPGDDIIVATGVIDADALLDTVRLSFANQQVADFSESEVGVSLGPDSDVGADVVKGGAGNDLIFVGDGDTVSGGPGFDSIVLGEWAPLDSPVVVEDFDPNEDRLVYDYPVGDPEPELRIEDDGEDANVYVNDRLAIRALGARGLLTLDDIYLTTDSL